MTALEMAKDELSKIELTIRSGHPLPILEKTVELSALLASCNDEIIKNEMAYNRKVKEYLDVQLMEGKKTNVSRAEKAAMTTDIYQAWKLSLGITQSLEKTIISLRRYAEQLANEMKSAIYNTNKL